MAWDDREPVFVRRGRWVYNSRNPVARVLMFASVVGLVGFYLYVSDTGRWSGSELRDAVHEAARDLEAEPQKVYFDYESMLRDAVQATGKGPEADLVITPRPSEDGFEIGAAALSETFCMRLTPPEPARAWGKTDTVSLTVRVSQGDC
ncbi:hypothetical protein ACF1CG_27415 [Streptomyces sp. NPDC014773]|uniref:hypothetical protein n=1 Tax=Streptomyces sp. NPDC014773 TaxID=3364908 RepID=UPI0036F7D6B0